MTPTFMQEVHVHVHEHSCWRKWKPKMYFTLIVKRTMVESWEEVLERPRSIEVNTDW